MTPFIPVGAIDVDDGITYNLNKYCYRSRQSDPIADGNYGIAMGCSVTFGQSIHERHRFSNLIEHELGKPIINLGIPGAGVLPYYLNLCQLICSGSAYPEFIIAQKSWMSTRLTLLAPDCPIVITPRSSIFETLVKSYNLPTINGYYFTQVKNICNRHSIKFIEWDPGLQYCDHGVDLEHPGIKQNEKWADEFIDTIGKREYND